MSEGLPQSKAHNRPKEGPQVGFIVGASAVAILTVAGVAGSLVDRFQQDQSRFFSEHGPDAARLGNVFMHGGTARNVDGSLHNNQLFIDYSGKLRDGTFPIDFLGVPSDAGYRIWPPLNRSPDPRCASNIPSGGSMEICFVPKYEGDKLTGYGVESKNPVMARDFNGPEGTVFQLAGSYKGKNGQLIPVVGQRSEPYISYTPPLNAGLVPAYVGAALAFGAGITAIAHGVKRSKSAEQRVAEAQQKLARANQLLSQAQNDVRIANAYAQNKAQEAAKARGEATTARRESGARSDQNSKW